MRNPIITVLSVDEAETDAQILDLPLADERDSTALTRVRVAVDGLELPSTIPVIVFSAHTFTDEELPADTKVLFGVSRDADDSSYLTLDDREDVVAALEAKGIDLDCFQQELEEQLARHPVVRAMRALVQAEIARIIAARQEVAVEGELA